MDEDQLIADYLRRLSAAAGGLPPDRRDELITEITAHIAEARAAGPQGADSPEHIRDVLSRLGEPDDIVRAAWPADGEDAGAGPGPEPGAGAGWAAGGGPGGGYGTGGYAAAGRGGYGGRRRALGAQEISAVILLLIGGLLAGIGWIVGVILLWTSDRWRTSDKWLGTLVWPGGLAAVGLLPLLVGAGLFFTSPACSPFVHHSGSSALSQPAHRRLSGPGGPASVRTGQGTATVAGPDATVSAGPRGTVITGPGGTVSTGPGGTVITGPGGGVLAACPASGPPGFLLVPLFLLAVLAGIGGPIAVAVYLLRRARPGPAPAPPPASQTAPAGNPDDRMPAARP
jgi:hypothetical protein